MGTFLGWFAWSSCLLGAAPAAEMNGSYLFTSQTGQDGQLRRVIDRYVPHEGDLVLFDDHSPTWTFLYHMAGTDLPDHSGIVIRLPDGRPALLESAPDDGKLAGMYVRLLDALPRLHQFQGTIYIRRIRHPLTPEQSDRLTEFALKQEGKRYALCRLLLQATPFRARGRVREALFGKTYLDRCSWFCSELVVAAGTAAGLFDPRVHRANSMYPRDLIYDDIYDLSATWLPMGTWSPSSSPATSFPAPPPLVKGKHPIKPGPRGEFRTAS
jgi:hypothetical protein